MNALTMGLPKAVDWCMDKLLGTSGQYHWLA